MRWGFLHLLVPAVGLHCAVAPYTQPCWVNGFSRPVCCTPGSKFVCFAEGDEVFTKEACCGSTYDLCFMMYVNNAERLSQQTCSDYLASDLLWFTRNCLVWAKGDRQYEQTVVSDLLESNTARCFHAVVFSGEWKFGYGLCVPVVCSQADVFDNIQQFLDLPRLTSYAVEAVDAVHLTELAPWKALSEKVDFVIPGFVNSGTSTLSRTLASHPEVNLIKEELDMPQLEAVSETGEGWSGDWRQWLCADLPPRVWVDDVLPEKKPGIIAQGFKNPLLLYSPDCVRHLAGALPKLVVALRDPQEWLLSMHRHNDSYFGFAMQDWTPPDLQGSKGNLFGRDHAQFGTLLTSLLQTWPSNKVMVVELEHLRNEATAQVVLDAVCRFLGVTPFSSLRLGDTSAADDLVAKTDEPQPNALRYARGLGASSPSWSLAELCRPDRAHAMLDMAVGLQEEYELLPRLLSRVGVLELGVSALLVAGGAYERHCREELSLPGAAPTLQGQQELLAVERRLRVAWRGEIGFTFRTAAAVRVGALACGAGNGPLLRETRLTLWDAVTEKPLWVSVVGPSSPMTMGFAFSDAIPQPIRLAGSRTYTLSVQASAGLGLAPSGHAGIGMAPEFGTFLHGVYSDGPWLYPRHRDEHAWEQAYVSIVILQPVDDR
mmetsp:Transcript_4666/g.11451  ORF Transcript_4666/g.11451 Transcript_4666/m.11451 type:complete len:657 (-) Transcript_4666:54-2024(-)